MPAFKGFSFSYLYGSEQLNKAVIPFRNNRFCSSLPFTLFKPLNFSH